MENQTYERVGQLFAALSHPARLRIVELLYRGALSVNDVARELDLSQSGTSQHLAVLARSGLLAVEPQGTTHIYRTQGPRLGQILRLMEEFCQIHQTSGTTAGAEETEDDAADLGSERNEQ